MAMYGTNFNPKIFTDITIPYIKFCIPHIGKISQHLVLVRNLHFSLIEGVGMKACKTDSIGRPKYTAFKTYSPTPYVLIDYFDSTKAFS
jgi:hypothetical protein